MRKWFNNNKLYLAGALVGSIGGYLYWHQVGCASGTCLITSKPLNSTLYGGVMGALFFGIFKKENKSSAVKKEKRNDF
ncbi:MAG: hypothetical protein JST58_08150 [Bacteroidetes bacterium]|nr:hypothetical protein [Bacteroidota bacterium]